MIRLDDPAEAKKVKESRRNVLPPVYNSSRLKEKPIPSLELVACGDDNADGTDVDADVTDNDTNNSSGDDDADIAHVDSNADPSTDLNDVISSLNISSSATVVHSQAGGSQSGSPQPSISHSIKYEPIFGNLNAEDAQAAEIFLDSTYEKYGSNEDLFMEKTQRMPTPLVTYAHEMKKDDIITGNKPFALEVSIFRCFTMMCILIFSFCV